MKPKTSEPRLTVKELAGVLGKSAMYVYLMRKAGYRKARLDSYERAAEWIRSHGFTKCGNAGKVKK